MKISVAITTYNGGLYLDEQILSILCQDLKPAEIIVCDDGSTDDTQQILERYQSNGHLKFYINPARLGLIENFKKAVSLCNADNYIALSDQDDVWLPNKLSKCAAAMVQIEDRQQPCMVYTDLTLVDAEQHIINTSFRNEMGQDKYRHDLLSLLYNNFINGCTILMNRQLHIQFESAPPKIYFNHDGWLGLLAFTFGKVKEIEEPLVLYRKHTNNLSIDNAQKPNNKYLNVYREVLKALKGDDNFLTDQLAAVQEFYKIFKETMPADKKMIFEQFLKLTNKQYLAKKLAYRSMINKLRL